MNDYLTRDNISNGFFTTTNLINFAKRNNVKNIGIVEIEEISEYENEVGVSFGTELLLNNYGESLVLFNITNIQTVNNLLSSRKTQDGRELRKHLLLASKDSTIFKKVYDDNKLSINYACNLLIKLGYYKGYKDAFEGFLKPFLNKMPPLSKEELNTLSRSSQVYYCINDINQLISNNFIKNIDNFYGILYYGNISIQNYAKLTLICNKHKLDLKFGTNFSDHRIGERIGVNID